MTSQEVRTFTAAIVLAGQYAEGDSVNRDIMVREAIKTTDALLEGLSDMKPLEKRIKDYCEKRCKSLTSPRPQTTRRYAPQDFIDQLPEAEKKLYKPLP